jgi:predicted HTH domain antitoxin
LDMKVITFEFPDSLNIDENEVSMLLAASLYEKGRLSLGQAADVAGLSKRSFAESLGKYGVSIFNFPAEDIIQDVKNA